MAAASRRELALVGVGVAVGIGGLLAARHCGPPPPAAAAVSAAAPAAGRRRPPPPPTKLAAGAVAPRKPSRLVMEGPDGSQLAEISSPTAGADRQSQRKILLLHTGGTLGMAPDATGSLDTKVGNFKAQLASLEELMSGNPAVPTVEMREYEPLLDSSCMMPTDWQRIAGDIRDEYYNYDGFVVVMGTDTMSYAASGVSFMLENLAKPVIFTGPLPPAAPLPPLRRAAPCCGVLFPATACCPLLRRAAPCCCFLPPGPPPCTSRPTATARLQSSERVDR